MSDPFAALRNLRIGCVKYLNSRPLIHAYDGDVVFDHPAVLARSLAADELDAALVPVFEVLRNPGYLVCDEVAVGCDGPVFSVYLAHRGSVKAIRSMELTAASLSSAHLVQVLLAEFHGNRPAIVPGGDAQLIIGNEAIERRAALEADGFQILDLGAEWQRCTSLPFVFAVWAIRREVSQPAKAAAAFRALKKAGLPCIQEIVADDTLASPELRHRYLTEHIRFDLDARGKQAMTRYRGLLLKYGFIPPGGRELEFC